MKCMYLAVCLWNGAGVWYIEAQVAALSSSAACAAAASMHA
jgi:hypothetical protein